MTLDRPPGSARGAGSGRLPQALLPLGIALGVASVALYGTEGFTLATRLLWVVSLIVLALYFESRTARLPRVAWQDLVAPAGIALALCPLYVVNVYEWPVQVGSDEIAIMTESERWADRANPDLFGLSDYLGHPALLFVVWGKLGELFGGIDLGTMRALHGSVGLLAIVASYVLLRQLLERRWAIVATLVLGLSHSLFMISRLAMRENTALLVEATALALLVRGLRDNALFLTFLGGAAAGLGYYVYEPARAAMVIWVLFLGALALLFRREFPLKRIALAGAAALSAFALVAAPVVLAQLKAPGTQDDLSRSSLLIFAEARELQREWVFADTTWEGIRTNIGYGLGTFNDDVVDHGWIYVNSGHGFVDPLCGALLWAGVLVAGWRVLRRRDPWTLLPLSGFLWLWLSFAFLVNKAPNYTRLLVTLPFVAYLVTEAIRAIVGALPRIYGIREYGRSRLAAPFVAAVIIAAIAAWNVAIASDYVQRGRESGDDIGSTGRYVQSRRGEPGIRFYLAASDRWPYYVWGFPWMWEDRMRAFAGGTAGGIVPPRRLNRFAANPPFALFMSRQLWTERGQRLLRRHYPAARLRNITPDGRLVVFEVPARASLNG
jgi:Dolichyl-phosphate-mannose-protein mannosyltransferase